MKYGFVVIRYIAIALFCIQLAGCATQTENACQKSPVLLTDLTKSATQRHVLLPDGTPCYGEAYTYGT